MPLRLPSPSVEMCTRIRFLGWAPGSRVPSQAPTISGSPAAIMGSGMIANPGISVNPNQSPNDNARYLFMVDLLIELQPKSARSQSGITLFRCLSPTIAIEGRVPAARPRHAKFCQNPPLWHPGYHKHTPDSGPPQLRLRYHRRGSDWDCGYCRKSQYREEISIVEDFKCTPIRFLC